MENKVKIGVLGYGVVGSGLIDIICLLYTSDAADERIV